MRLCRISETSLSHLSNRPPLVVKEAVNREFGVVLLAVVGRRQACARAICERNHGPLAPLGKSHRLPSRRRNILERSMGMSAKFAAGDQELRMSMSNKMRMLSVAIYLWCQPRMHPIGVSITNSNSELASKASSKIPSLE